MYLCLPVKAHFMPAVSKQEAVLTSSLWAGRLLPNLIIAILRSRAIHTHKRRKGKDEGKGSPESGEEPGRSTNENERTRTFHRKEERKKKGEKVSNVT